LVGRDVTVRDLAGGIHISKGREARERPSEEAGAFGTAEDVSDHQSSKYSEPQSGEKGECE
jgi:hypothetical protein